MQNSVHNQDLIDTIHELLDELPAHRAAVKRAWKGTVGSIFVGVTAVIMALTSHFAIVNVREVRTQARVAACAEYNQQLENLRDVFKVSALTLVFHDPNNLLPEEHLRASTYSALIDTLLIDRDCSTEGIRDYISVEE